MKTSAPSEAGQKPRLTFSDVPIRGCAIPKIKHVQLTFKLFFMHFTTPTFLVQFFRSDMLMLLVNYYPLNKTSTEQLKDGS